MADAPDVMAAEPARGMAAARMAGHGMGFLRGTIFTALLVIYVVWTLAVSVLIMAESGGLAVTLNSALLGLAFLVSLPALGYVSTVQDRHKKFMAPTVMVVALFVSCGLGVGFMVLLGLGLASTASSVWEVAQGVGVLSPILAAALAMLLGGLARTAMVWEQEPKRLRAAKNRLYFAPPALFLICQALYVVGRLAG